MRRDIHAKLISVLQKNISYSLQIQEDYNRKLLIRRDVLKQVVPTSLNSLFDLSEEDLYFALSKICPPNEIEGYKIFLSRMRRRYHVDENNRKLDGSLREDDKENLKLIHGKIIALGKQQKILEQKLEEEKRNLVYTQQLIERLSTKKNQAFITEQDLSFCLTCFDHLQLYPEEQNELLYGVFQYNEKLKRQFVKEHKEQKRQAELKDQLYYLIQEYPEYQLQYEDILLLRKYGYFETIKDVLKTLKKYHVQKNPHILSLLLFSNAEIIETVGQICTKYEIDINDFNNLPGIFFASGSGKRKLDSVLKPYYREGQYQNFIANVAFMQQLGVDLHKILDKSKVLFVSSNQFIQSNLQVLQQYSFDIENQILGGKSPKATTLMVFHLAEKLDRFIEVDCNLYIHNNPTKLTTFRPEMMTRIEFANKAGISIYRSDNTIHWQLSKDIVSGNGLSLSMKEIERTIPMDANEEINASPYKDFFYQTKREEYRPEDYETDFIIDQLDARYLKAELPDQYNIHHAIYSRNKILYYYNRLKQFYPEAKCEELLYYAFIYKKNLSKEDLIILKNELDHLNVREMRHK